jgi:hypothetical protein
MHMEPQTNSSKTNVPETVQLPAPTAWPITFAFGLTLLFAGLLTNAAVSVVGAVLSIVASVGWFRDLLPLEREETVPATADVAPIIARKAEVARVQIDPEIKRVKIPVEIYPYTAGIKGGLAGAVAMAILAVIYGLVTYHSVWYPINLLAAIVYAQAMQLPMQYLMGFHLVLLLVATLMHLTASVLVGLLYGVMLPMFPRRPILLGGFIVPLIWTGLLYSSLGVINPLMDKLIDWKWFVVSQIGFGVVAGLVVVRQSRIRTDQFLPFAVRAGLAAPGIMKEIKETGEGNEKK